MKVLVGGSVAYDFIMEFGGAFKDEIIPDAMESNMHVSFLTPTLRREYGGTAGNIAYNLRLLDIDTSVCAAVGSDYTPYREWMERNAIDLSAIDESAEEYTAQCFILTDKNHNQINAFHPGALDNTENIDIPGTDFDIAILAPTQISSMLKHAAQLNERGIPFVFDPGQVVPLFSKEQMQEMVERCTWMVVNHYESLLITQSTGLSEEELKQAVDALIITNGDEGSVIYANGEAFHIPVAAVSSVADPTGCGDAYRSGLLLGLANGLDWQQIGQMGAIMGAIKVEHHGTQNHAPSFDDVRKRYQQAYGEDYPL